MDHPIESVTQIKQETPIQADIINLIEDVLSKSDDDNDPSYKDPSDNDESTAYHDNSHDDSDVTNEWLIKFGELRLWSKLNKRMPHPCSPNPIEQDLSKFCVEQWSKKSDLDKSLIDLLESTESWFWADTSTIKSTLKETNWEILCGSLMLWVKLNDRMPYPYTSNEIENEQFEFCQQQWLNQQSLSASKIARLESINQWFWGKPLEALPETTHQKSRLVLRIKSKQPVYCDKQKVKKTRSSKHKRPFEERFKELEQWVKENGRIPKSQADPEEAPFSRFCSSQKRQNRIRKLTTQRKQKMESLPGWHW